MKQKKLQQQIDADHKQLCEAAAEKLGPYALPLYSMWAYEKLYAASMGRRMPILVNVKA